jgi:hypothetical protein
VDRRTVGVRPGGARRAAGGGGGTAARWRTVGRRGGRPGRNRAHPMGVLYRRDSLGEGILPLFISVSANARRSGGGGGSWRTWRAREAWRRTWSAGAGNPTSREATPFWSQSQAPTGCKGPSGPDRSRASWLCQGTMGHRADARPLRPPERHTAPEQRRTRAAAAPHLGLRRPGTAAGPTPRSSSPRHGHTPAPPRPRKPERRRPPTWDRSHQLTRPHAAAGTPRNVTATAQRRHSVPYLVDVEHDAPPQRIQRRMASPEASATRRARPTPLPRHRPRRPR